VDEVKKQIEQLDLFNEKVHEFRASSFAEAIFAPDSGISMSFGIGKASTIERRGPTMDSIKAWAPSIRLLISVEDRISFKKMKALYAKLAACGKYPTKDATELLEDVELFLAKPLHKITQINMEPVQINGKEPTVLEFMEQFIYGDILHLDENKRPNYVSWRNQPVIFPFVLNDFCVLGAHVLNFALDLTRHNDEVIKCLKSP